MDFGLQRLFFGVPEVLFLKTLPNLQKWVAFLENASHVRQ